MPIKFSKDANVATQALLLCIYKAVAFFVLLGIFLIVMLPDLEEVKFSLTETFKEEKTKILMLSFIQNPAVLYKLSEIEERKGSICSAIRYVELAIGLLEMHGADKQIVNRYSDRAMKLMKQGRANGGFDYSRCLVGGSPDNLLRKYSY